MTPLLQRDCFTTHGGRADRRKRCGRARTVAADSPGPRPHVPCPRGASPLLVDPSGARRSVRPTHGFRSTYGSSGWDDRPPERARSDLPSRISGLYSRASPVERSLSLGNRLRLYSPARTRAFNGRTDRPEPVYRTALTLLLLSKRIVVNTTAQRACAAAPRTLIQACGGRPRPSTAASRSVPVVLTGSREAYECVASEREILNFAYKDKRGPPVASDR